MTRKTNQSGNVLFYILLCVGLFAALGYAFSRGGDSGANRISDDKARLIASEIINYGGQLREAMIKMKLRGCTDTTFEISSSSYTLNNGTVTNSINSNAPPNGECSLFSTSGGSINPMVIPKEGLTSSPSDEATDAKAGHGLVRIQQILDIGTNAAAGTESANDIIFRMVHLNKAVCLKINEMLGIVNTANDAPISAGSGAGKYLNGSLSGNAIIGNAEFSGKMAFCRKNLVNTYIFEQVLLAR